MIDGGTFVTKRTELSQVSYRFSVILAELWRNFNFLENLLLLSTSEHGRKIRAHAARQRVCVTVSYLDELNLGRSGIASSTQYRSLMAFGMTQPIDAAMEERIQMERLIDRTFPGRAVELRPIHDREIDPITVIRMPSDQATTKVKTGGVVERDEEHSDVATWAGVIPVAQTIGAAVPDHKLRVGPSLPANVASYAEGRRLDQVLSDMIGKPLVHAQSDADFFRLRVVD